MSDILKGLNDKQYEAVVNTEGPCLVIAGAGSGKTNVAVNYALWLKNFEQNVSVGQLASELGVQPQSMSNKLYRDTFTFDEVVRIANILGSDVKIIIRESGKEFY